MIFSLNPWCLMDILWKIWSSFELWKVSFKRVFSCNLFTLLPLSTTPNLCVWIEGQANDSAEMGTPYSYRGMSTMVVTPPAAAARVAVQKPSHVVRPGSFTCTWQSTMPGITTLSPTSNACHQINSESVLYHMLCYISYYRVIMNKHLKRMRNCMV